MGHSEVDVDFKVYYRFAESETVFIELYRDFKSNRGQCDVVIRLKKILYGQSEAALLWYEKSRKWFVRSWFCGKQGGYLPVHV